MNKYVQIAEEVESISTEMSTLAGFITEYESKIETLEGFDLQCSEFDILGVEIPAISEEAQKIAVKAIIDSMKETVKDWQSEIFQMKLKLLRVGK